MRKGPTVSAFPAAFGLFAILLAGSLSAQSILTYAGGGTTEGLSATSIDLVAPRGLAVDTGGRLYIAESDGNAVQRVNLTTGLIELFAGNGGGSFGGDGGPARRASLKRPWGMTFDDAGNLYIADRENGRVRKVDAATGIITTVAGSAYNPDLVGIGDGGAATAALLRSPIAVAWSKGDLYIADEGYDAHRIRKVDSHGIITTVAGSGVAGYTGDGGDATSSTLDTPLGVVIDADGNILIADSANDVIRRVDAVTKKISTLIGGGSPADDFGDGLPATSAKLLFPAALAFDRAGNLYIADTNHERVRRYDANTHIVTTVAGNGLYGGGDGNVATEAGLNQPFAIAFDAAGNLFIEDSSNSSVRRVDATTKIISTVAGGGTYIGDGRVAPAAILLNPRGMAFDRSGSLLIADGGHTIVRRVDATTGVISTWAGQLFRTYTEGQDGTDRRDAVVGYVLDIAVDKSGRVFLADALGEVIWLVGTDDKISRYGGGNQSDGKDDGDGGPATSASFYPEGISLDATGNLYIADSRKHRVRRIDAATKIITTVAGTGTNGYSGDGSAATAAQLDTPVAVVPDRQGNLFISDLNNGRIRRVDAATKVITTYAGGQDLQGSNGDGGVATAATISPVHMAIDPGNDDLYVADQNGYRLRKIDARTQIITTVAGKGTAYYDTDFSGDNGAATEAKLNFAFDLSGVVIDAKNNLYIADTTNDRVRVINACVPVGTPQLTAPGNGASVSTAPTLTWGAVDRAFRYDVLLDTVDPPQKIIAADVSDVSYTPANLQPSTRYFWRVVAKSDRFCTATSGTSSTNSFTTSSECIPPVFESTQPADGAAVSATPVQLSWQSAGANASYDVYLGTLQPPPLVASGLTATSYSATISSGQYAWFVVAHAACDTTKTSTTSTKRFQSSVSSGCLPGQLAVTTVQPANGASDIQSSTDLSWSASGVASSFDLYFGTVSDPPLLIAGLDHAAQTVNSLAAGTKYYWRVVAKGPCDTGGVSSSVATFTTRSCAAAGATAITFAPASVPEGSTYAIIWSVAAGLDADGGYFVERSTSPTFAPILDSQVTSSTAASFVASGSQTLYHRVRAIPGCDATKSGPVSDSKAVNITPARANVVFTVTPSAVVAALNEHLEEKKGTFTLENIGPSPLQVIVGRQELNGSAPFFTIVDPAATDGAFVTLDPRTPKRFDIRYAGPATNVAGSFQGVIFVAATGEGLAVTPYAFVNLKIGDGGSSKPEFTVNGAVTEYAAFPPFSGDDSTRPPLSVSIRNSGTGPMELGAEIGPEVWLVPDAAWNSSPIAPGATRTINLSTRRSRAPNGSPLPRYTFFTVRARDGATARLLVQDTGDVAVTAGRPIRLGLASRSFMIPDTVSRLTTKGATLATQVRLGNIGSDPVQIELIFTPEGSDGFDSTQVKRAVVIAPPNDVVTLTDPLDQIFHLARPSRGSIEVRVPPERLGLVRVTSSISTPGAAGAFVIPVLDRGEGARAGSVHQLGGVMSSGAVTTSLTLSETTGIDKASVHLTLFDAAGTKAGETTADVPAYGIRHFDNLATALGAGTIDGGRLEVAVTGGGAVVAVATVGTLDGGATFSSTSIADESSSSAVARIMAHSFEPDAVAPAKVVVPVLAAPVSAGSSPSYKTGVGFIAPPGSAATFFATFLDAAGKNGTTRQTITVPAGATKTFADVARDLFGRPAGTGSVIVEPPLGGKVYATLQPSAGGSASSSTSIPLPSTLAEALTSAAAAQRPLFYDGLEQSLDSARGTRWLLVLNEVSGASGSVNVRLYEAGNRTRAIAEKTMNVGPYQQLQMDTVFGDLGLDSADRRKDRANVEVVVTAVSGSARIAAMAVSVDNGNGDTKTYPLVPVVGSGATTSKVAAVSPQTPATPPRRRSARH
jgi:sugar lactone lactonase YvrE